MHVCRHIKIPEHLQSFSWRLLSGVLLEPLEASRIAVKSKIQTRRHTWDSPTRVSNITLWYLLAVKKKYSQRKSYFVLNEPSSFSSHPNLWDNFTKWKITCHNCYITSRQRLYPESVHRICADGMILNQNIHLHAHDRRFILRCDRHNVTLTVKVHWGSSISTQFSATTNNEYDNLCCVILCDVC